MIFLWLRYLMEVDWSFSFMTRASWGILMFWVLTARTIQLRSVRVWICLICWYWMMLIDGLLGFTCFWMMNVSWGLLVTWDFSLMVCCSKTGGEVRTMVNMTIMSGNTCQQFHNIVMHILSKIFGAWFPLPSWRLHWLVGRFRVWVDWG